MNAKQEAKLGMYNAVNNFCKENASVIATLPALQQSVVDFSATITAIRAAAQAELEAISGITKDKNHKKLILCQTASSVASAVFAFASLINNMELKQKVNFSFTGLGRLSKALLPATCRNIHAAATENLAALAPYGITQTILDNLIDAIQTCETALPAPRNAASLRSVHVANLITLFRQADSILFNRIDKLMMQFSKSHSTFYLSYKNNRIIIDPATANVKQ